MAIRRWAGRVRTSLFFFFQAEDGIRDYKVTGVQTCALPIWTGVACRRAAPCSPAGRAYRPDFGLRPEARRALRRRPFKPSRIAGGPASPDQQVGRASGRGRGLVSGGAVSLKKKKK